METNKDLKVQDKKSNLTLDSRKKLVLTGVIEVLSFDDEKILLNTCLGMLTIKGQELKMNKLDVQNGDVIMVGTISSLVYATGNIKPEKKDSILARLFR